MNRNRILLALAAGLVWLPTPALAAPAPMNCSSTLNGRDIAGDLRVLPGRTCTLNNASVNGDVTVPRGATLNIVNSNVEGTVKTERGFAALRLSGAIVQTGLSAVQGGRFSMDDSQVIGDVTVNEITGAVSITRVTINGSLNCAGNRQTPTGTWIRVDGLQRGQCSRL